MSDDPKNEAEVLAVALEIAAVSVADVVAWADARIAVEDHPHWSVCELTTMGASYDPDVARALREIPGVVDEGGYAMNSYAGLLMRWLRTAPEPTASPRLSINWRRRTRFRRGPPRGGRVGVGCTAPCRPAHG